MPQPHQLVESALEFITTSCDQYGDDRLDEARRLKHSTVSLCTGIELMLKARLAQEHWTLVLLNPDRYRLRDWERGSFQSVGLPEAKTRLSEVCGVRLSEQAETAFSALADLRNKLIHFAPSESAERVTGLHLRAWHYLLDLLDHEFLHIDEKNSAALKSVKLQMMRREEFLDARFEEVRGEIAERVDAGLDIILCPFCAHPSLAVGDGAQCLLCGTGENESQEYAEEYARRATPWMGSEEYYATQWAAMCSECRQRACVTAPDELRERCVDAVLEDEGAELEPGMDIEPWYCFNCAAVFDSLDIVECTRCGQLFARQGRESLCPTCSW